MSKLLEYAPDLDIGDKGKKIKPHGLVDKKQHLKQTIKNLNDTLDAITATINHLRNRLSKPGLLNPDDARVLKAQLATHEKGIESVRMLVVQNAKALKSA